MAHDTTEETTTTTQPTAAERHTTAVARLEEARDQLGAIEAQLVTLQATRSDPAQSEKDAIAAALRADAAVTRASNELASADALVLLASGPYDAGQARTAAQRSKAAYESAKTAAKDARAKVLSVREQVAKDALALDAQADTLKEQRSQAQRLVDALEGKADELHMAAGVETLAAIAAEHAELVSLRDDALQTARVAQAALDGAELGAALRLAAWPERAEEARTAGALPNPSTVGARITTAYAQLLDALQAAQGVLYTTPAVRAEGLPKGMPAPVLTMADALRLDAKELEAVLSSQPTAATILARQREQLAKVRGEIPVLSAEQIAEKTRRYHHHFDEHGAPISAEARLGQVRWE